MLLLDFYQYIYRVPEGTLPALTRVVCRTLHSRGKSLTPDSRVEIDESRSCREDWRDVTEAFSDAAMVIRGRNNAEAFLNEYT